MPTRTLLSEEEYLRTSFDGPDREYVDGEVVERNVGDNAHGRTQLRIAGRIFEISRHHPLEGWTELRLRIQPRRYVIPDVCAYLEPVPQERIPTTPPFLVGEVVSRDDRWNDVLQKLDQFYAWGVPNVWLADPSHRKLYVYDSHGLHEVNEWQLPEFGEALTLADVFGAG